MKILQIVYFVFCENILKIRKMGFGRDLYESEGSSDTRESRVVNHIEKTGLKATVYGRSH